VDRWECGRADIYVFCLPSFLAEFVGYRLGHALRDKFVVNVSNRFMGTEALCQAAERTSAGWSMAGAVAFNSPPLLAYQRVRNAATSLLYSKPFVLAAPCRGTPISTAASVIADLFGIREIRWMPSELELAFENINSIVHAVQDLACLRAGLFNFPGPLYDRATYTDEMVRSINAVTADRDLVAASFTIQRYRSLAEFDATTFATPNITFPPGSATYRQVHPLLSKVPRPTTFTAHGYEDVGWSMVPMEALGRKHGLSTPYLSRLIDEWNRMTGFDYRSFGRGPMVSWVPHRPGQIGLDHV
jgi:hypothetical protein